MIPAGGDPTEELAAGASAGSPYALGVLSGNPRLGPTRGPEGPGGPPHQNPPSGRPRRLLRRRCLRARTGCATGLLFAAAALLVLAAGAGISHAAWKSNSPARVASPPTPAQHRRARATSGHALGSTVRELQWAPGLRGVPDLRGSTGGSGPSDVSAIAAKADPGLVDINTTLGYQSEQAAGTGIVLTSSGEVLTNNHVINGATTISATDVGNGKTYSASVVGYDRTHDVAVLQLHNASGLQTSDIGDSSSVAVGQGVVGVGNAGGTGGTPSAAGGTVTALNQSITASDEGDGTSGELDRSHRDERQHPGRRLGWRAGQHLGPGPRYRHGGVRRVLLPALEPDDGQPGLRHPDQRRHRNRPADRRRARPPRPSTSDRRLFSESRSAQTSSGSAGSGGFGFGGGFGGGLGGGLGDGSGLGWDPAPGAVRASPPRAASIAGVVTSSPAQEAGLAQGDVITSVNNHTVDSPTTLTKLLSPFHPGGQGDPGLHRRLGPDAHGHRAADLRPPQ